VWNQRGNRRPRAQGTPLSNDVVAWVLSLPWVVERPYSLGISGVRMFAVDCGPLEVRHVWLLTGLFGEENDVAVIVPADVGDELEAAGVAMPMAPMPPGHVLTRLRTIPRLAPTELEAVILDAYAWAMS
jgi:hypothetical protein